MCLLILKPCGFMKNLFCIHEVTALDLFFKNERKSRAGKFLCLCDEKRFFNFIAFPSSTFIFIIFFLFKGYILIYSHKK